MSPYVLQLQVIQYSLELVPWIWINILLIHTDFFYVSNLLHGARGQTVVATS